MENVEAVETWFEVQWLVKGWVSDPEHFHTRSDAWAHAAKNAEYGGSKFWRVVRVEKTTWVTP